MKHALLAVVITVSLSLPAWAEAEPTNSSAKQAYGALTKSLEKLKTLDPVKSENAFKTEIGKAQKKLEAIKEKEPGFDLSAQAQQIKEFEEVLAKGQADKVATKDARAKEVADKQARDAAEREAREAAKEAKYAANAEAGKVTNEMEALFVPPTESRYSEVADPAAELKARATAFDVFLATNPAERVKQAIELLRYIEPRFISEEKTGYDKRLADVSRGITAPVDNNHATVSFHLLREYELFWNALEKTLPDDATVRTNAELTRKALSAMPSLEALKGKAAAYQKESLAKVRLTPAVRKDATMEGLFRKAFAAEGWNEEILVVNLLDTDWHIEKNKLTGAILLRYQSAAIKAKNKAGKCIAYVMSMKQDWDGSGYSATPRRYGHNGQFMACEN